MSNIKRSSRTGAFPNEPVERKIFPGGCIAVTNNGSVGHAYYWASRFTCSHDINPVFLKNHPLSPELGMFLIGSLEKQAVCFEYARKWRPIRMIKSKILLPVTESGEPDYDFMEMAGRTIMANKYRKYLTYINAREGSKDDEVKAF